MQNCKNKKKAAKMMNTTVKDKPTQNMAFML